jgi:hypothetical protein
MSAYSDKAIEVDPAVLANTDDEDYGCTDYATSTESLTSSINEYIFENGMNSVRQISRS